MLRAASLLGLCVAVLALAACGGGGRYAGLSRSEALQVAKQRIEATLPPDKRQYYETSIWNVVAQHGVAVSGTRVWLIGIWNGQAERGDCALASKVGTAPNVRLISCAKFPRYAR